MCDVRQSDCRASGRALSVAVSPRRVALACDRRTRSSAAAWSTFSSSAWMHIRVSVMNVWCIRVSRGLPASRTSCSWNRMSSSPTDGRSPSATDIRSTISSRSVAGALGIAAEDLAGRGAFDRLAGQVHVADVVGRHVDDEQAAVADRTKSPSWVNRCIPSRSGPRLTPSLRARSASPSCAPGLSSRDRWPSGACRR